MEEFFIGVVSGMVASAIFSAILFFHQNRVEVTNWLTRKNRYSHLSGEWHQYHLTNDKTHQGNQIWVHHVENFNIGRLATVSGDSSNDHKTQLDYDVKGKIDQDRLVINYINRKTSEKAVVVYIDNILSGEELHGVWLGYDFDENITAGPIIYSRKTLQPKKLNQCVSNFRVNILGHGNT